MQKWLEGWMKENGPMWAGRVAGGYAYSTLRGRPFHLGQFIGAYVVFGFFVRLWWLWLIIGAYGMLHDWLRTPSFLGNHVSPAVVRPYLSLDYDSTAQSTSYTFHNNSPYVVSVINVSCTFDDGVDKSELSGFHASAVFPGESYTDTLSGNGSNPSGMVGITLTCDVGSFHSYKPKADSKNRTENLRSSHREFLPEVNANDYSQTSGR